MKTIYYYIANGSKEQRRIVEELDKLARIEGYCEQEIVEWAEYGESVCLDEARKNLEKVRADIRENLIAARMWGVDTPEVLANYLQYVGRSITENITS